MFCERCVGSLEQDFLFCPPCGTELDREEVIIRHYFEKGFEYTKIVTFLGKFHEVQMSIRTLKERLKCYGLCRRSVNEVLVEVLVRRRMRQLLDWPSCMSGYRAMWHTLRLEGMFVPRNVVERLLRELDPDGCKLRKAHRLTRRNYVSMGPNYCWHIDGYDKLKPYGFPIHGCIDGWTRKIMWLRVSRTNNNPTVRSDCGTENGDVAAIQCYFRSDEEAHIYGSSPHNQHIEGWWSFFRKSRTQWWISFFKYLIERDEYTPGNELQEECLWFSFSALLQQDVDFVKNHWNTHYIRQSRFHTVSGRPDELYNLCEHYGVLDYIEPVTQEKYNHVADEYLFQDDEENITQEYFQYVMDTNGLQLPSNWREAFTLYHQLLQLGQGP